MITETNYILYFLYLNFMLFLLALENKWHNIGQIVNVLKLSLSYLSYQFRHSKVEKGRFISVNPEIKFEEGNFSFQVN